MSADAQLMEALLRVEHKLDLLLAVQGPDKNNSFVFAAMGDANHVCPVCTETPQYLVDAINKVVTRKCGCSTGKLAPIDLGAFAPPPALPGLEDRYGNGSSEQEDRRDPDRRRGPRGR